MGVQDINVIRGLVPIVKDGGNTHSPGAVHVAMADFSIERQKVINIYGDPRTFINPCFVITTTLIRNRHPSPYSIWLMSFDCQSWYRIGNPMRPASRKGGFVIDDDNIALDQCDIAIFKTAVDNHVRTRIVQCQ